MKKQKPTKQAKKLAKAITERDYDATKLVLQKCLNDVYKPISFASKETRFEKVVEPNHIGVASLLVIVFAFFSVMFFFSFIDATTTFENVIYLTSLIVTTILLVLFFYALIEEIHGRKVYWREIK
jgi:sterol desaturase/sphingolipid hydroxylase (fatty acid hydroxylase superfamily)